MQPPWRGATRGSKTTRRSNEPLTTARFSGLYGVWYPHGRDEKTFIQALLIQCRATVLAMRAIREVNPHARRVQTDDISKSYGTREMAGLTSFYNDRRWLSWDLLCGKVDQQHPLWDYLVETGIAQQDLLWCRDNPCPPDIIGVNYYPTSERWLDHRVARYPAQYVGTYRGLHHADIETPRSLATPTPGIGPLLLEAWERYGLPIAVTEAQPTPAAKTRCAGSWKYGRRHSRPGKMAQTFAPSPYGRSSAPTTGTAWSPSAGVITSQVRSTCVRRNRGRPRWRPSCVNCPGARPCRIRCCMGRDGGAGPSVSVARLLRHATRPHRFRSTHGISQAGRRSPYSSSSVLAVACAKHDIQLLSFSSDLVFDGEQQRPYVESDLISPLNVYGLSKAEAERKVLGTHPASLVVTTSAFFGPWDSHNFVTQALRVLADGMPFAAANDMTVSPTYVPDLVHACLDLLIDRESGIWHLSSGVPLSWAALVERAAGMAGIDTGTLNAKPSAALGYSARRPLYSALRSERGVLLPSLDDALGRYLASYGSAGECGLRGFS